MELMLFTVVDGRLRSRVSMELEGDADGYPLGALVDGGVGGRDFGGEDCPLRYPTILAVKTARETVSRA